MAIQDLKAQIARAPQQPGVYLFLGAAGETLYVGKARVLRERVRSYLAAVGSSPRLDALLSSVVGLEAIVTDSVVEALALENRLIKQRNPRFNVLLRDDKTYPYLELTTTERAPRILVARRVERNGNVYAGPFMPAAVARRTMSLTHRLFGIRSCNEIIDGHRGRPCLEYDIKRCLAPCVESICTIEQYRHAVDQAKLLLEGRQGELIESLRDEMGEAAAGEAFERAAHLRDAIRTIETVRDRRNSVESPSMGDRDVFGVKAGPAGVVVQVFQVRRGRVCDRIELVGQETMAPEHPSPVHPAPSTQHPDLGTQHLELSTQHPELSTQHLLATALQQFYADRLAPAEVHIAEPIEPDEQSALEAWLTASANRRVRILVPQRGGKRSLVELATRNAGLAYQSRFGETAGAAFEALDDLRVALHLPTLPRRIECFDISTLQGRETVASMVVAAEGRMRRSEYRKFRIRGTTGSEAPAAAQPDDFAAMKEVVLRRYRRLLEYGGPFPDLILIDGGKGQVTAAYAALAELGLERLVAVGLAKQEELLFTRDRADGIALRLESPALRFLQRVRDEAHRFALTFHRRARTMRDFRSDLDDVPGIGPRRRRQLLKTFGSVGGVKRASREDLEQVIGSAAAERVIRHFA